MQSHGPCLFPDNSSILVTVLLIELQRDTDRLQQELDRLRAEVNPTEPVLTRWDVATIVITLVGGLVATVAAVLGVAQWIRG